MKIKRYTFKQLSIKLKEELRKEVLANFPKIKVFQTRFYYQIPPDYMFIAKIGNKIVGQRYLTTKVRPIDGKRYKIGGIGVSINPNFHGKGVGQKLTQVVLNFIESHEYDFVMAATSNKIAKHIMES